MTREAEFDREDDLDGNGPSDGDAQLTELLAALETPEPSPAFVEDVLLRRLLHAEGAATPPPSPDFVADTVLRRQLELASVPAPSADFVDRITTAVLTDRAGPLPRPLRPVPGAASRGRSLRLWAVAGLIAAAVLFALLPLLFPAGAPFASLDEKVAQELFDESLNPDEFARESTNPAARTAALLVERESRGGAGRLAFAMPRTYETADQAELPEGSLPFELGFSLRDDD